MAKKQYDPLWEVVGEKAPLQGAGGDVDAVCPWCRVIVHLGEQTEPGRRYECGLCGGVSVVAVEDGAVTLKRAE